MKKIYENIRKDSLYRNSSFLMSSNIVVAGLGFIFWAISTRVFTTSEVGLATTLISATDLIVAFALLGLNIGLVRYLPASQRKNDKINSVFSITTLAAIGVSVIFILGLKYFSPQLLLLRDNLAAGAMFVIFVVFSSLAESIKSVFRSFRASQYVLVKNTILNVLKIILIFPFLGLGVFGIFSSWLVSLVASCVISLVILTKKFNYKLQLVIKREVLQKMTSFSFANYMSEFFERAPRAGIPLIITTMASPQKTAYYYIGMSIALFLFMLPEAIGSSFYAESSTHEKELALNVKKTLKAFVLILIPAILAIVVFGSYILLIFGKEYSREGVVLLRLLSFSAVFIAINSLCSNIMRIKYHMKEVIFINLLGAVIILGLSYTLVSNSVAGIGWAWLVGNVTMSLTYLATTWWYRS